jgi:hypothetical protein
MNIVCTDNLLNHPDSSISKNQSQKTKNQVANRIANVEKPKRHRIAVKNHGFSEQGVNPDGEVTARNLRRAF